MFEWKKKFLKAFVPSIAAASAFTILLLIAVIMGTIVAGGWDQISLSFFLEEPREGMTEGGIFPAIVGTFVRVLLMSMVGVPVGAITAIYLCEYASQNSLLTRVIRFAINTLAGIPAIVFGLFGLGFYVTFVGGGLDTLFNHGQIKWSQPGLMWASLTMALLTLPVVIVSVEEAIRSVPQEQREASLALGSTKWHTVWRIVIPNAFPGILTGAILAISRGAGEVAPILFTGAAYYLPHLPQALSDQFMDLGYHIYIMATQSADVDATGGIQFATTLVLLALTFGLNLCAAVLRYYLRRRVRFS